MNKKLFNEFEDWCKANEKDPYNEENFKEYINYKEKEEKAKKEALKTSQEEAKRKGLKEIWNMIVNYTGIDAKVPNNEDKFYQMLDATFDGMALAVFEINQEETLEEVTKKVFEGE